MFNKKKAISLDYLFWIIFGVVVLVVSVFIIMALLGKGQSGIEFIKNLFRWS